MNAETEASSDVQDVSMADATSAASSNVDTTQSLPANRFDLELEFIQSLASPAYLHHLATTGILYQSSFLDFLRYLRYWKRPEYAKYIVYPNCLYFLDLLVPGDEDGEDTLDTESDGKKISKAKKTDKGEAFRREMAQVQFRNFVHEQQFYSWQFRSGRLYGKGEATKEEIGQVESNEVSNGHENDADRPAAA